jgi:hypothetical protein
MGAPVTLVLDRLQQVLDALAGDDAACALSIVPCRVSLYPGDTVSFDICQSDDCANGDGQLWANLVSLTPRTAGTEGGSCLEWVATANIGIVRCGPNPESSADEIRAAADQQALDADEILNAITCCTGLPLNVRDSILPRSWAAIPEQGGCVGGQWTVSLVVGSCCP